MKALPILMIALGLTACAVPAPTKAVPCIALTPRTDALRSALVRHPQTPEEVGQRAADVVLGTEAVCK